jgi:hypothetical protein
MTFGVKAVLVGAWIALVRPMDDDFLHDLRLNVAVCKTEREFAHANAQSRAGRGRARTG